MNINTARRARLGLAAMALAGTAALAVGCSAPTDGSLANQIQPTGHVVTAAPTPTSNAAVSASASGVGADKAAQMKDTITNSTDLPLTLISATHTGTGAHWQQQAQQTLAANSSETVTDYAAGNDEMDLTYQDPSGNPYYFKADDPAVGHDSVTGETANASLGVTSTAGSGWDDNSTFTVYVGHSFAYTGAAQGYVVPAGITSLNVQLIGGSGGESYGGGRSTPVINGAEISGRLDVTPGEVLTIGVGGKGQAGSNLGLSRGI